MRVRSMVPVALQPAARRVYLTVGAATAGTRMEPDFMVIGGQRCGTTSIFKVLAEHPQVMRPPVDKGTDYFTLFYYRDLDWYRAHFPIRRIAELRTRRAGAPVAFEACTYYMFHPFAIERIAEAYPDIRLVAMLRDPVERAFSAYKHELARGFETETDFMRALDLEQERLVGEVERMRTDLRYESHAHRHQSYLARGQYADQLERVLQHFPREHLHVMESEAFFERPGEEYAKLVDFLGLAPFTPAAFEQHNARPSKPMPAEIHERLTAHYAPYDGRLSELLKRPPHWALR